MFDISYDKRMNSKTPLNCLIILFIVLAPVTALAAANHYILDGGTGDGSAWNNALDDLPSTFVRGDTYYVGDGTYGSHTMSTALSSTLVITIKKATAGDHGTEIGWSSTYGDGQAIFTSTHTGYQSLIAFTTAYWVWDGMVGSGNNEASYGFKIAAISCDASGGSRLIGAPGVGADGSNISNITISHTAFDCCTQAEALAGTVSSIGIYSNPITYSASNMTVSHNYFYNHNNGLLIRNWSNSVIENNYFGGNWHNDAVQNGQQLSPGSNCDDISLRGNTFSGSLYALVGSHPDGITSEDRWLIYNNIVIGGTLSFSFGNANSSTANGLKNWQVHHNTFYGTNLGGRGAVFIGTLSNVATDRSYAYNNLFYNCISPLFDNPSFTNGAVVHTHNAHFNSTGTYDNSEGGTAQVSTGSPFISAATGNFALKYQTVAGKVLGSPFVVDYQGKTRTRFDRGAFEYSGSVPTAPGFLR